MRKLLNRVRKQDGFTLIELIVVVAILGILAAVLTPRVLDAIDNAKKNGAESSAKQVQLAMERYALKNGYPTLNGLTGLVTETTPGLTAHDVAKLLEDYVPLNPADYGTVTYAGYDSSDTSGTPLGGTAKPKFYVLTMVHTASGRTFTISPNSVTAPVTP